MSKIAIFFAKVLIMKRGRISAPLLVRMEEGEEEEEEEKEEEEKEEEKEEMPKALNGMGKALLLGGVRDLRWGWNYPIGDGDGIEWAAS